MSEASSFRVDQGNVLQAHAAVQAAADKVRAGVHQYRPRLRLGEMGKDPVSLDAAAAFTHRLQLYADFARDYAEELQRAAAALRETALAYGWTDDDIARGFPSTVTSA